MKKIILSIATAVLTLGLNVNAQVIRTVAGVDTLGYTGDHGAATMAQIGESWSVIQDTLGNLYYADDAYNLIRKIDTAGIITTIAGNSASYGGYAGDGGAATAARLNYPSGMAFDKHGNLYFADNANFAIRKISTSGIITTIAGDGSGRHGYSGDGGPATSALMMGCVYVAVDKIGNVYFTDGNTRIRKVDTAGIINTIAGTSAVGFYGNGVPATSAALDGPGGIVIDTAGNIYFADQNNNLIRKINTSGIITTYAGMTGRRGFTGDGGAATAARINTPGGLAIDNNNNIYFADESNGRIRMVNPSGIITTVAGSGTWAYAGDGSTPLSAAMKYPSSVFIGRTGNMYITDRRNYVIREIRQQNVVTITPGAGTTICSGTTNVFSVPEPARDLGLIHQWLVNGTDMGVDSNVYTTSSLHNGDVISYRRIDPIGHFAIDSSAPITITVNPTVTPSVYMTKNTSDTICNGINVTYVAHPTNGGSAATYQWLVNGTPASTGLTYTYSPASGDIVKVVLTSSLPCPTVNPVSNTNAAINVLPLVTPSVTLSGTSGNICDGTPVTYTAIGVNGGTSPFYQWKKFGVTVGTGNTYRYTPSNGDHLTCEMVTNAVCPTVDTVRSSATMVIYPSVTPVVTIASNPINSVSFPGQLVTFSSEVTYGGSAATYQWYENGVLVPGATSATYAKNIYTDDTVKCVMTSSIPCVDHPTQNSNTLIISAGASAGVNGPSATNSNMTLFPNPNAGSFTLSGNLDEQANNEISYEVFDITGRKIAEGNVKAQQQRFNEQINLGENVLPGQYILKINNGNGYKLINFQVRK